jgi:hypothetical protein
MTKEFRIAYIQSVKERYLRATKAQKGRALDEFCRVCHLNRKYAITKIHQERFEREAAKRKRSGRRKLFPRKIFDVVESVWCQADYPWSVRLTAIFGLWLPWIETRYRLSQKEQPLLLRLSPSTIDRSLKGKKAAMKRRL